MRSSPPASTTFTSIPISTGTMGPRWWRTTWWWSYQMAIDPAYGAKFADITYINIQGSQAWAENPTDNVEDSGGVVKIDDKTVRVSLENPNPGWWGRPLKDRSVHLPPYPKHLYKDIDPATAFGGSRTGLSARRERGLEGRALRRGPVLGTGSQRRLCVWGTLHRPLHHPLRRPRRERRGHRGRRVGPHPCGHRGVVRALGDQPHLQAFPQRSPFGSVIWLQRGSEIFKDTNIFAARGSHGVGARPRYGQRDARPRHALQDRLRLGACGG